MGIPRQEELKGWIDVMNVEWLLIKARQGGWLAGVTFARWWSGVRSIRLPIEIATCPWTLSRSSSSSLYHHLKTSLSFAATIFLQHLSLLHPTSISRILTTHPQ